MGWMPCALVVVLCSCRCRYVRTCMHSELLLLFAFGRNVCALEFLAELGANNRWRNLIG